MQHLRLTQKLLQKLSPQQILLMKLLQVPSVALDQRIKQEIEENPALEDFTQEADTEELPSDNEKDQDSSEDEFDITDYVDADDIPEYKTRSNNYGEDDGKTMPFANGKSFYELLRGQLNDGYFSDKQKVIAETIIGNIDDSGYLEREVEAMVDDLAFTQSIIVKEEEVAEVLHKIQKFDPAGVGARNLQECLILQLQRKDDGDDPFIGLAIKILRRHFDAFTKKHYEKILKKEDIGEETLRSAIDEIVKLNPKPGNSLSETTKVNHYVIPDFVISNEDGELVLSLNSRNAPELKLNRTYKQMLENFALAKKKSKKDRETLQFVKQKIDSARWFIDAIQQRQHTLQISMQAILDFQYEYFITGDDTSLKPMILKDIADRVNLDISTISRVANSKYVQTSFGTILLKSLFSESLKTESGEDVSTKEVKKILNNCVEAEDKKKPMTDEKLVNVLKEKGYKIARRTVAKYREQLGIPVARLRKIL
ncbi:MAG: RNA polymerase sigma-54 factor [Bacteroidetes bacterium 4572_77]|nr:MAG: RNA polymerase sigma-54 factor [Bacteroidetes bacterium 4572_77]